MKKAKRGNIEISFGMMFSIILIIAFIAVAGFAIMKFLSIKDCAMIGIFKEELKKEIDIAWKGQEKSSVFESNLPSGIKEVCFVDFSKSGNNNIEQYNKAKKYEHLNFNMFFSPYDGICPDLGSFYIEHIDIGKITSTKNPYCIKNKGKIKLKIEKSFGDILVGIK